jgi:hypothetical protein
MGNSCDIVVMGDVHGEFGKLNTLVSYKRPQIILQVRDFGYWPKHISKRERKRGTPLLPKMHDTKLYWADGNHEDFDSLMDQGDNAIYPNVFHMKRGSTLELPDGRVARYIGRCSPQRWHCGYELQPVAT